MISQTKPQKYCVNCGKTKEASLEFWYASPQTADRLSTYCKDCTRAKARERSVELRKNPEKRAQINEKSKLRERAKREKIKLAKLALAGQQPAPEIN